MDELSMPIIGLKSREILEDVAVCCRGWLTRAFPVICMSVSLESAR